ncbi:MAG TPA: NADPH-dependent F420 reductase [Hyphomicrobiaceae bacterium]|jgi:NADPH-dependent F420 reductase|nr:NADPH-dependent F420 reductase [Hyphomicrobiaceae bacterium]
MAGDKPAIAIIGGTGPLGSGLARRLYAAGFGVVIGSRTAAKAEAVAADLAAGNAATATARLTGADNAAAAAAGEVVFLTVPWSSHAAILADIQPHLAGKLLVDTTVPLVPPRVARVQLPKEQSAALAAKQRLGAEARVVSAFHNLAAHKLAGSDSIDCDVLVFGDDPKDREIVVGLAKAMGLDAVHAGPLANSVAAEALTSVLIGINRNYKVDGAGIRITGIRRDV